MSTEPPTPASSKEVAPPLSGYALWLIPSKPATPEYQSLISHLASLERASPTFVPHITLLHPISTSIPVDEIKATLRSAIEKAKSSSSTTAQSPSSNPSPDSKSLFHGPLRLKPAQSGSKYYQSVLAPVHPTPPLLALRKQVQEAFGLNELPDYFPHLSLLYGELTQERRDELAKVANDRGFKDEVEVEDVVIVDSEGVPEGWKMVGRESLV
ncbi:hypothetical protein IAR55_002066 [Kwoniella newhampshirensis]|uniref:2',3'-cyclic-nucleotide 3'-phosphodiesterase n=1 Tax=Kwoniella newhampshirensis TaxID=1651941 RepID=A0AAW0YQ47_9TREE